MNRLAAIFNESPRLRAPVGACLLVLGVLLLGFTGHADRLRAMGEDALGGFVLTGAQAKPGPASDGKLVLAVGPPEVTVPARDEQFGVAVAAPALVRKVEMFQWKEVHVGGQRSYQLNWYDHPMDSSAFAVPEGHANPGAFPIHGGRFDSTGVSVAGFKLAPELVHEIPGVEPVEPSLAHLPPNMAATFQAHDGVLTSSEDSARPHVGDLRISWMQVAPEELTVFARNDGGMLVPTSSPAGDPIAQVLLGRQSLANALADAPRPPPFKWARRVLAVLLAWAGVALMLPPPHRRDRLLALAIAVVPLGAVGVVSWWGVRMPAAIVLVFVTVAAAVWSIWRWRLRPREA